MNRKVDAFDSRGNNITCRVAPQNRHSALLQPARARSMQSGRMPAHIPRTQCRSPGPAPGANKDHITAAYLDPCFFLPRIQVLRIDRSLGLQIRNTLEPGDVHQYPASEDSFFEIAN